MQIYKRKAIALGDWIDIMGKIELNQFYIVYRRAYKGENAGNENISSEYSNYVVDIAAFGDPYPPNRNRGDISYWFMHTLGLCRRIPVNVLAHNCHMKVMSEKVNRSMWVNHDYWTDCNKFYGL